MTDSTGKSLSDRFDALLHARARTLHVVGVCLNRIGTVGWSNGWFA